MRLQILKKFFLKFFLKNILTNPIDRAIMTKSRETSNHAGVAQLVEQLICNQQVGGSNPSTSSTRMRKLNMGAFPSGQRGQTVNLLSLTSVVRIHPLPPEKVRCNASDFFS